MEGALYVRCSFCSETAPKVPKTTSTRCDFAAQNLTPRQFTKTECGEYWRKIKENISRTVFLENQTLILDTKGTLFCFFVSRLLGPRVCGRQEETKTKKTHWAREGAVVGYHWAREGALHARHTAKTHTEHERVQFWVPLNTRGGLTRTPHSEKHTLSTRGCSFEYHWTRGGALKGTKARTRTEETL